jgi:hypothetical protein
MTSLTLKPFESLGRMVAIAWARMNFDTVALPEIAAGALQRSTVLDSVTSNDIVDWVARSPWLTPQVNLESDFGEPPIAVFWHPKFFIEVLFWTTGSPAVHEHGFVGAFRVLEGSSLQSRFNYRVDRRINHNLLLGELVLRDVKLLRQGDVEPIRSGSDLIHSTFHLDTPSVTIVVRTRSEAQAHPQYVFYRPYVAINDRLREPEATRRVQVIELLDRIDSDRFEDVTSLAIRSSDLYVTFQILKYLKFSRRGLARFDEWMALAREHHGEDVDRLRVVLEELDREVMIRTRRRLLVSREHRFFLALLMNVAARDIILKMIQERFPQRDPKALAAQWAFEMSGLEVSGIEFNDVNRSVFVHLLNGLSISEAVRRLETEYDVQDDGQRQLLAEHCAEMRRNLLFRPLLEDERESGHLVLEAQD